MYKTTLKLKAMKIRQVKVSSMLDKYEMLKIIFLEIKQIVDSPNTDTVFSNYNTPNELLDDLDKYIEKLEIKDETILSKINFLVAPTNDLQEVSLSSGWGQEFIRLSMEIDKIIEKHEEQVQSAT